MMRSLFSGVSGLKNHQTRMDVIGNNISNVNTTGFKSGRVTFTDTLSQTLTGASKAAKGKGGTNPKQVGLGSVMSSIDTIFTNGSVQSTGKNTDLCLSGSGLFIVNDSSGTYYTRNGAFEFDEAGNYVLPGSGMFVQGWMAKDGVLPESCSDGNMENIVIPAGKLMASKATEKVKYTKNLDASTSLIKGITLTYSDGTSKTLPSSSVKYDGTEIKNLALKIRTADGSVVENVTAGVSIGTTYEMDGTFTSDDVSGTIIGMSYEKKDGTSVILPKDISIDLDAAKASKATTDIKYTKNLDASTSLIKGITLTYSDGTSKTLPSSSVKYDGTEIKNLALKIRTADGSVVENVTAGVSIGTTYEMDGTFTSDDVSGTIIGMSYEKKDGTSVNLPEDASVDFAKDDTIVSATLEMSDGSTQVVTSGRYTTSYGIPVATTITVNDSLGAEHIIPLNIEKTGKNVWRASLAKDEIEEADGTVTKLEMNDVNITFTDTGMYKDGSGSIKMTTENGSEEQDIAVNFTGLTQLSGSSTLNVEAVRNPPVSATLEMSDGSTQVVTSGRYTTSYGIPVATTITVNDSLGAEHIIPLNIEKTGKNVWRASLAKTEIKETDGTVTKLDMSDVNIFFTESGMYKDGMGKITMTTKNGSEVQDITVNFTGLTQFSGSSTVNAAADGNAAGSLSSVSVDASGIITGTYTNGIVQYEAQVAVAQFNNAAGLTKTGNSLYQKSNNSGTATVSTAADLGVTITPSALEMSNVDVANEFSDMIITQRGFQSNSKIITVSDEMLETLINMKR